MDVATVIYTVFCAPTELWSYLVAVTRSGTEEFCETQCKTVGYAL